MLPGWLTCRECVPARPHHAFQEGGRGPERDTVGRDDQACSTADTGAGVGLAVALGAVGDVCILTEKRLRHGARPLPLATHLRDPHTKGSDHLLSRDFWGGARSPVGNKRSTLLSATDTDIGCAHAPRWGVASRKSASALSPEGEVMRISRIPAQKVLDSEWLDYRSGGA